jgi:broad specificity phosphatase PhoE
MKEGLALDCTLVNNSGATAPGLHRLLRFISKTTLTVSSLSAGVKAGRRARSKETRLAARLTLIAHAATEAQRRAAFPLDEPIAEPEIARIAALAWRAPRAKRAWSAPEQRAQQTAHALGLDAVRANELRDCDYGRWRGRTMDEVHAEEPEGILAWLSDPAAAPHGGESIQSLIGRAGKWLDEQCEIDAQHDAGHIVAVTHPAVIRAAIVHALRLPAPTFWRFDIPPLSLTDLRFSRGGWTLRCTGCSLHGSPQAGESDRDG